MTVAVTRDALAAEFVEHRPRLMGIAYRLLGSAWDAEDVVAEAMVRWLAVDRDEIREPAAFLTTVVTRLALDQLRSARATRDHYVGEWLPEPVATGAGSSPLDVLERREDVSLATLRMMEALTPPERAVLVLHEALAMPHADIAGILDMTEVSARQHLRRARAHLDEGRPRFASDPDEHVALFERVLAAFEHGDVGSLEQVLAADVVAYSDGGGKARAARFPIVGADAAVRFFAALRRRFDVTDVRRLDLNGGPGALLRFGRQVQVLTVAVGGGRVREIDSVMNPDKLRYLRHQLAGGSGSHGDGTQVPAPSPQTRTSTGRLTSAKKSPPLSSTTMKAGKSSTSMRQTASIPSSGYSSTSTLRMQSCASRAAGPPIEPR
jgi:RNA polymerase sigma-70 factor (ECF subfamily)